MQGAIAQELAAAQEALANLPHVIADARKPKRRRRPLVLAALGAVMVAGGAVAFSIIRRSSQPEPVSAAAQRGRNPETVVCES